MGFCTSHKVPVIGRHCQKSKRRTRLATRTYVLRSAVLGTIVVHRFLNHPRAITLCWMAKSPSKRASISSEESENTPVPESIDLGTITFPTKPIAYRKVPKKTR